MSVFPYHIKHIGLENEQTFALFDLRSFFDENAHDAAGHQSLHHTGATTFIIAASARALLNLFLLSK